MHLDSASGAPGPVTTSVLAFDTGSVDLPMSAPSIAAPGLVDGTTVAVSESLRDDAAAAAELVALMRADGMCRPFVVSSSHGIAVVEQLHDRVGVLMPGGTGTQVTARATARSAWSAGADSIVAIGGGRCLDVAKLAAARAGVPLVVVPTQLSHDGICSPVAVLPKRVGGVGQSLAAVAPRLAFFSVPTLLASPRAATRAGVGDLLSNPLALLDWQLAEDAGLERVHPGAHAASMQAYELIEPLLERPLVTGGLTPGLVTLLAHAIAASGRAMLLAGTSRPASGAEHKVSHAIDALFGPRAHHGEQVALACLLVAPLHGLDVPTLARVLVNLGLPVHPHQLRLSSHDLVRVLLRAPATRPGRLTVLEKASLDERGAADLVRWVWPDA